MDRSEKEEISLNVNEKTLLSELKRRNPAAIECIVHIYGSLIKSVIHRYLYQNQEALDECFNDVLLAVWNHSDQFDDKKNEFKNWICAIAKYRAIDALRRERKHRERFVSLENDQNMDWKKILQDTVSDMEEGDDSLEELEKLLSCLSNADQDLFFRKYVKEQSIEEISKATKMNRDLIYSHLSRGKKKIRDHMDRMESQKGGIVR